METFDVYPSILSSSMISGPVKSGTVSPLNMRTTRQQPPSAPKSICLSAKFNDRHGYELFEQHPPWEQSVPFGATNKSVAAAASARSHAIATANRGSMIL
jgi:hypothetical protein